MPSNPDIIAQWHEEAPSQPGIYIALVPYRGPVFVYLVVLNGALKCSESLPTQESLEQASKLLPPEKYFGTNVPVLWTGRVNLPRIPREHRKLFVQPPNKGDAAGIPV